MQQYADIYLLQNHSTCFWCPPHLSSGVLKTVTAASGTGNIGTATSLQRGQVGRVGGKKLYQYHDPYQRLRLQFLVLLMMGEVGTRNM